MMLQICNPTGNPTTLRYWKDTKETSSNEVTARVIQTTSYALLAVLLSTDKMYANPIVKWLTEKQRYGGGFISTQVNKPVTINSFAAEPVITVHKI